MKNLCCAVGLLAFSSSIVSGQTVVVQQGDTLSAIALRELGDANRWTELCEINQPALSSCNTIRPGDELRLAESTDSVSELVPEEGLPQDAPVVPPETQEETVSEPQAAAPEADAAPVVPAMLLINAEFDTDIDGWVDEPDANVVKTWSDGNLVLNRGVGSTQGAARQSVSLDPGKKYNLMIEVADGRAAFRVEGTDQGSTGLDLGPNSFEITATELNGTVVLWPFEENGSALIASVTFVPAD